LSVHDGLQSFGVNRLFHDGVFPLRMHASWWIGTNESTAKLIRRDQGLCCNAPFIATCAVYYLH
jgi:hypothetical protein